jgi:hypothetical protein
MTNQIKSNQIKEKWRQTNGALLGESEAQREKKRRKRREVSHQPLLNIILDRIAVL